MVVELGGVEGGKLVGMCCMREEFIFNGKKRSPFQEVERLSGSFPLAC